MKNLMEYKGYYAKIEYCDDDKIFFGTIEGINDLISFEGTTIDELEIEFHNAVEDYLSLCAQCNKEPEKSYKGSFNVRINPQLHKKASIIANSECISLNQFVEYAIADKVNAVRF